MAVVFTVCSGLGKNNLTHWVTAAVCLPGPRTHMVLWRRGCPQCTPATSKESLPAAMANPSEEPLKKCFLCGKHVHYKNVQLLFQLIYPHTGCVHGRQTASLCGKKQEGISKAIKRAQIMGLMQVMCKGPAYLRDLKFAT
ncbi:28S ribosomal protein S18c, mitochondrial-like isoform X1 [Octodon degus]|uniref:28S ribosomal protein S18c, mitochondrial-like isoform X1 n=1 Tax=Octodon degus TaxID=10160 RepID=A0A6P6D6J8_OCTDE|nr:28S ribosomal protein S18c, mitochondrial-like isoform X1 [Octodon degus]